jgi:hypothetical protein
MWHIDTLIDNNRETNNDTKAIAMQQLRKYATVLEPLLRSDPRSTLELLLETVFSLWYSPMLYHSIDQI